MKKLAIELEVGDEIELLNGSVGVVSGICVNGEKRKVTIIYENGMKTYALPDEELEIL